MPSANIVSAADVGTNMADGMGVRGRGSVVTDDLWMVDLRGGLRVQKDALGEIRRTFRVHSGLFEFEQAAEA